MLIMINMDPKIELLHLYCVNVITTGAEGTVETTDDRLLFNGCQKHPTPSAKPHQTPCRILSSLPALTQPLRVMPVSLRLRWGGGVLLFSALICLEEE